MLTVWYGKHTIGFIIAVALTGLASLRTDTPHLCVAKNLVATTLCISGFTGVALAHSGLPLEMPRIGVDVIASEPLTTVLLVIGPWIVLAYMAVKSFAIHGRTITNLQAEKTSLIVSNKKLVESEARYRLLAESAGDMLVVLDLDLVRRYVSPGCTNLVGYTPEELLASPPELLLHPDEISDVWRMVNSLLVNPAGTTTFTYRLRHRNGHWIWIEARIVLFRNSATNAPQEIYAVLRDISRRKAAEIALRESEERHRLLLQSNAVTAAVYMLDVNGNVESWNAGAQRIKGYTSEEIVGRNFATFFTPEDVASGEPERVLACTYNQGRFTTEAWRIRKDGSRFLARIRLEAIFRDDGTLRGFAKVTHDITKQRIEDEQQRIILEAAPNGIIIVDESGIVTLANSQAEKAFDYPPGMLIGQPFNALVPTAFQTASSSLQQTVSSDMNGRSIGPMLEHVGYRCDGSEILIEIMLRPVQTPRGRIIVVFVFEITDRKRQLAEQQEAERAAYQAELEKTNINLDQLSRHLKVALDRAEQANQAKSRFLAGITHELRTPLHGILGYAELLMLEDNLTPRQSTRLEVMMASGQHLLGMINAVLDMSQIEADQLELQPAEVSLPDLLNMCIDVVRPAADAKGLSLSIKQAAPCYLFVDPTRLRQVVINLLGNAVKFTPSGEIEVRQMLVDVCVRVEVVDTGPGIRSEHLDKLFQTFERLNARSVSGIEGSGLGLAIAARLVFLMNGRIGYEDNPGGGSVFWFELPMLEISPSSKTSIGPSLPTIKTPSQRILVVDDESLNRSIASGFLSNAGHQVVCVDNGVAAVEAAATGDFDAILMDVRMPGMNGLEATRQIRDLPAPYGQVRIIAVTAQAFAQQIEMCREAGMNSHISKPFKQAILLAALEDTKMTPSDHGLMPMRSVCSTPAMEPQLAVFDRAIFEETTICLAAVEIKSHLQTLFDRCVTLLARLQEPGMLIRAHELVEDAHRLAGSSGTFGFLQVAASARQFEAAAVDGTPEAKFAAAQFEVAIATCINAIQQETGCCTNPCGSL